MNSEHAKQEIQSIYDKFAEKGVATSVDPTVLAFCRQHYGTDRLSAIPRGALALACGCGDPVGAIHIAPGYSVVDLGCGGGLDVALAARQAGVDGRVVGLDLAPEMIAAARRAVNESGQSARIHFRVADIENMALLPRTFANVVTTNCVIGFCVDKLTVYSNIFRILNAGGVLVSCELMAVRDNDAEPIDQGVVDSLFHISTEEEHLAILRRLPLEVLGVKRAPLTAKDLEVLAAYPGLDGSLLEKQRVQVVTIIAQRQVFN